MDAIEMLRQQHVEANSAFQGIEAASPDQRGGLWSKLHPELKMHEQMEERFVYDPVARDVGQRDPMLKGWHDRHHTEVGEAERMIGQINGMNASDPHWLEMIGQLGATLE